MRYRSGWLRRSVIGALTFPHAHAVPTSLNGLADSLTLTCVNLPTYLTCRATPATATLAVANGTATVSLYLDSDSVLGYARNTPASYPGRSPSPIAWALLLSPFGLFAGLAPWSRRRLQGHPCLRLLILLLAILPFSRTLSSFFGFFLMCIVVKKQPRSAKNADS
jgi:hypothetical protein